MLRRVTPSSPSAARGVLLALCIVSGCGGDSTGPGTGRTPTPNFIRFQSDPGDVVGGGASYEYTQANSVISARGQGAFTPAQTPIEVTVGATQIRVLFAGYYGLLESMVGTSPPKVGYYGGLRKYPWHNPARGGMDVGGNGRGCLTISGWYAIDKLAFAGGKPTELDLRFEQRCDGNAPALHGAVHWTG